MHEHHPSSAPSAADRPDALPHEALFYDEPDEVVAVAVPWLREGLDLGDAALVAVGPQLTGPLRAALGNAPGAIVVDRHELYRTRTPTAITAFRRHAAEHAPSGRRVRVVGEVDFGATPADWNEWQAYESVINVAFRGQPLWGLCVFGSGLPEPVLAAAHLTHPQLRTTAGPSPNPAFVEPADYLQALPVPEEPLEATQPVLAADGMTDLTEVAALRRALRRQLSALDGPAGVLEDFLMAVDEMASNAVRHGSPPAGLRLWTAPGRLVCTVRDSGRGFDDPFAGYGPAHGEDLSHGGMGLWLARQLCDHVAVRRDSDGTSVRLSTAWS